MEVVNIISQLVILIGLILVIRNQRKLSKRADEAEINGLELKVMILEETHRSLLAEGKLLQDSVDGVEREHKVLGILRSHTENFKGTITDDWSDIDKLKLKENGNNETQI